MASIRFVDPATTPWSHPAPGCEVRRHHPGDDGHPQLFEVQLAPHTHQEQHAHDADEIIYVTAGSLRFGAVTYGPGSSVMVPGDALYQFHAGADGVAFLNFRPRAARYLSKEEHLARRRVGDPPDGPG